MLSINQDKRLWFIELITWWEGRISSSHLIKQFGISRTQAQNDIAYYQSLQPNNLQYHASHKGCLPEGGFVQAHIHPSACLAQYVLQEMQVNIRDINISPEAQQLALTNVEAVKPWLFEEKS